jgi:HK97 gp10 family phage protein
MAAALEEMKKGAARRVANQALTTAAEPMVDAIKRHVPDNPLTPKAELEDSILASPNSVAGLDAAAAAKRRGADSRGQNMAKGAAMNALRGDKLSMIFVGPARRKRSRATKVAHIVEYGAGPHVIKPRKNNPTGKLSFSLDGDRVMPAKVLHPGHKPRAFMRPGFEEAKEKSLGLIAGALRDAIAKAAERARRRALRKKG